MAFLVEYWMCVRVNRRVGLARDGGLRGARAWKAWGWQVPATEILGMRVRVVERDGLGEIRVSLL